MPKYEAGGRTFPTRASRDRYVRNELAYRSELAARIENTGRPPDGLAALRRAQAWREENDWRDLQERYLGSELRAWNEVNTGSALETMDIVEEYDARRRQAEIDRYFAVWTEPDGRNALLERRR
jgi:hypothetical protein